ncbi:GNAT family N-acetyltransferase [Acidovorax sp. sif1233]|jgi:putative acetyltransferase|uniref:GNAT family N-acetyltransferase n=1 Tax=unclassified Acidovorax TaxID=2684926 RepID=UPI001C47A3C3|nr:MULTISPECIES: GNAT family N-acetyltransferase [unclassified Acidovorax]MBV7431617.1 GNAT family N-acetyltransferase [Acidovorax sp. sif0732]MBV7452490.1 GNAT family N-acetyltransferase [Acidovorax sp. sif0715]MBV7458046.1 GNAT family N-acetyltransferase [Acidovorax sp. sif1233]
MPLPEILIRDFRPGDEALLHAVFHASVHGLAARHYTPGQLAAWAPPQHDAAQWAARMRANQPFVAQAADGNAIAGFADLQPTGYIDQFFVAPDWAGQGVARALMAHIHAQAARRGIARLHADVSLAAESFFAASGFEVLARQHAERQGVVLRNARMAKLLGPH